MYATCFDLYLGHPQAHQYKNRAKEKYNKNLGGPILQTLFL